MPVLTDADAILRTVLLNPEDDAPRLVYADWLDERGRWRHAAFIRAGVARPDYEFRYGGMTGEPGTPERDLFDFVSHAIWSDLSKIMGDDYLRAVREWCVMRRGFVDRIELPAAAFLAHAGALWGRHPIVSATLTDRGPAPTHPPRNEWYWSWQDDEDRDPSYLPASLFRRLPGSRFDDGGAPIAVAGETQSAVHMFPTEADALAALSRACVRHGREEAGLAGGRLEGRG